MQLQYLCQQVITENEHLAMINLQFAHLKIFVIPHNVRAVIPRNVCVIVP